MQKFDHDGHYGPVVAVKLTYVDAHKIAKDCAPAKVTCVIATENATTEAMQGRWDKLA